MTAFCHDLIFSNIFSDKMWIIVGCFCLLGYFLWSTHSLLLCWSKFKSVARTYRRKSENNTLFSSLIDRNRYCKLSTVLQLRRDPCFLNFPSVMFCDIFQKEVVLPQPCSFPVKHLQITNEQERQQSTWRSFSPWNRLSLVSYYWKITISCGCWELNQSHWS